MIDFVFWFLVVIVLVAIVIIGVKWLMGIAGIAIPAPLMYILGLICFLILLFALWHFVGPSTWNTHRFPG